jgi:hypothetical protein
LDGASLSFSTKPGVFTVDNREGQANLRQASQFDDIDQSDTVEPSVNAISFRLDKGPRQAQADKPSAAEMRVIPYRDSPKLIAVAQSHLGSRTALSAAQKGSDGYMFFNEDNGAVDQDRSARIPFDALITTSLKSGDASGYDTAGIYGDSAADINGDNRSGNATDNVQDPIVDDYSQSREITMSRGGLTLSGGYSSVEGVSLGGKIARENIGGRNRSVAANARYSRIRQLLELGYVDGNFLDGSMGFAPSLFALRTSAKGFGTGHRTPFAQSAYGMSVQFNRTFPKRLLIKANYRLSSDAFRMRQSSTPCDAAVFGSPFCNALGNTTSSMLSLSLGLDRRKHQGAITRGFRFQLAQDIGLGGSAPYTRARLGAEAHLGLGKSLTLMLDAEGGHMAPLGKHPIPLFERFYAGDASLRGFDLRGVGPKVRPTGAAPGQHVAIGGRAYYAARAELSASIGKLSERFGVQPSLFVDAGSVFGARSASLVPGELLLGNSPKPRVSAGASLALKTPAGTLRLDYAHVLSKQPGDRTQAFSIAFGTAI